MQAWICPVVQAGIQLHLEQLLSAGRLQLCLDVSQAGNDAAILVAKEPGGVAMQPCILCTSLGCSVQYINAPSAAARQIDVLLLR